LVGNLLFQPVDFGLNANKAKADHAEDLLASCLAASRWLIVR
jgi:hypothetical protein